MKIGPFSVHVSVIEDSWSCNPSRTLDQQLEGGLRVCANEARTMMCHNSDVCQIEDIEVKV